MLLTNDQITFIEWDLRQQGLTYKPLREELLDHICCVVEAEMEAGKNFHTAYQQVVKDFGEQGIKGVQVQTIHLLTHKKRMMKRFSLTASLLLMGIMLVTITQAQNMPSLHPIGDNTRVTSHFGPAIHPITKKNRLHQGIDFAASIGTPIYATADGEVLHTLAHETGRGMHIILKHDDQYSTLYAHLSRFAVKECQKVKKGDIIGYSGNTGASTGPHLHYEVLKNGEYVDPRDYF